MDGLVNHEYAFALGQEVETTKGKGWVMARSKLAYPSGIYLVLIEGEQRWMHPVEMAAVENEAVAA